MEVKQARWKWKWVSDKVDDIVQKIFISDKDVYVTNGGRILRNDTGELRVRDGSTIQVMSRMRGGDKHKNKKSKVGKKQAQTQHWSRNSRTKKIRGRQKRTNPEVSQNLIQVMPDGYDVVKEQALRNCRTGT